MRWKSRKLVSTSGSGPGWPCASGRATGPRRVGPTKAVVLVLTPSIDLARKLTSSTNTPGARYSGTGGASLWRNGHVDPARDFATRRQVEVDVARVRQGRERLLERRRIGIGAGLGMKCSLVEAHRDARRDRARGHRRAGRGVPGRHRDARDAD